MIRSLYQCLIFVCFFASSSLAQAGISSGTVAENPNKEEAFEQWQSYDQPIEPDRYLIRPGEKLTVTFLQTSLLDLELTVNAEGRIVDKQVGVYAVAGRTLTQLREMLYGRLSELFNASEIVITPGSAHRMAVLVIGEVVHPGRHSGWTSQRVSDILKAAGGVSAIGSTRRIRFLTGDDTLLVDLERAEHVGDYWSDPPLYAGEIIFVPHRTNRSVTISGEVLRPREIERLPDDDIKLLLALAGGVTVDADESSIRLVKMPSGAVKNGKRITRGDRLIVPAKPSTNVIAVKLFGAVLSPGTYLLSENSSFNDLLEAGGGEDEKANVFRSVIFRRAEADAWGSRLNERYPISVVMTLDRPSLMLADGDSVYVPRQLGFVKVSGLVMRSGLFEYTRNATVEHYINLAGGYLARANRSVISLQDRVAGITRLVGNKATVLDGDEIIVTADAVEKRR